MPHFLLRFYIVSLIFVVAAINGNSATLYTYTNGGSSGFWSVAGTWTTDPSGTTLTGSAVPADGDVVHILNGYTVTLNANVTSIGLSIVINSGGKLNLSTFTIATINSLSGAGTLSIGAAYFPTITSNSFVSGSASGATVEYYDFTGTLPASVDYPNLTFTNSTTTSHAIAFSSAAANSFTIFGNLVTQRSSTGALAVNLGSGANIITVIVRGNVTIGAGTTFGVGAFSVVHSITLHGNLTNNGTIDLFNGTQWSASHTGAATINFTGATDNTVACNGTTDLYSISVNKGTSSTYILSFTSTNVANLKFHTNGQLITVTTGTLKLGPNISIDRMYGSGSSNYDLGPGGGSPMFWIDGATVNTNSSAFVAYGKFRISSGSFTCMGGEGTVIREEGQYIIEGGTFTTEKFRPSTTATTHRGSFTMTGGIFNASGTTNSNEGYARFSLPFPEQVFIMSGGTINVSNPEYKSGAGALNGGIHIGCKASNYNVTGGTFNAILSGNAAFFNISSVAPFWNLNILKSGGTPTTVRLAGIGSIGGTVQSGQPLTVLNDFTIEGANSPVFDANTRTVTVGRHFTINSGATYTPNSNTTTFNGSAAQNFDNSGTITTGLYNLTINKSAGALTLGGSATSYTVTQTLTISGGVFNDGGKTVNVSGNIYNEAVHTGSGSITLNGTGTQTISGDGNGILGNVTLNNTSTPGAILAADCSISGILTLAGTANSLLDIQHYLLSLTNPSATALTTSGNSFSSAKMIRTLGLQSDRGVRKTYGNLNTFTFAFGTGSSYTPASIKVNTAPTFYGTITARPVASRHPLVVAASTNNLSWNWKVVSAGFVGLGASAVTHTYNYLDADVSPAGDDVNYVPARYNNTTWTVINDVTAVDETANVISLANVGYIDGEFTAGIPASYGVVKIFYSKRSGNWDNVGAGTTPWSNVSHTGADATTAPTAGDQVFIGDGGSNNHVITITANNRSSGGLEINTGSTLDVGTYTGHNFGRLENVSISGSGLLRISSATATAEFPAGDFGNFIRSSGGTVEYYSTGSQNYTLPLNSLSPTLLPLISYKNLTLTPGTGRSITLPNQDMRIYNLMTVQGASATGLVRLNSTASRTLTVNSNLLITGGNLQFQNGTAQTLQLDAGLSISSGALFDIASTGTTVTNLLTIEGNLVNHGTLDFSNGSYVCNTTFAGNTSTSITGSGGTTDFNILTVSKGTSDATMLEVNSSAFSLSGGALPLVLTYGTFRLSSSQTVTFANGSDFTIPSTSKLSANGGTLQLTGPDGIDLLLAGTLEVLNGTVDIGTAAADNSIEYAATGSPTIAISGGSLNVQAQVRRSVASAHGALIYQHSGSGNVSVGISSALSTTRGVFEMLNTGSSFTMTGGTLGIRRGTGSSSISDLYLQPTSYAVTGGTIDFATGGTSMIIDVNSAIPVYNVSVSGTTNTARLEFNGLTLRGALDITGDNVFNANSLNVNIAGNFRNANTSSTTGVGATSGGYRPGSANQTTTFNSTSGNQTITGTSGNLTNFANLVINNTASSGSVSLQPNTNLRVNGTLTISNGTLAGSGNTITAAGTISNSATHTSTAGGNITVSGSSMQTITGNGSGKFGNLVLDNTVGAAFSANQEITGTLTFVNGALYINSRRLTLSNTSPAAIAGSTSTMYIISSGLLSDEGVVKSFAPSLNGESFTFPIGTNGKYTPATYTLTTGAGGGNITVTPVNSKHPSATGSGTAYIRYYWNVSHTISNISSVVHTYHYVAADESGNVADYRDARFSGGVWTIGTTAGNPNTSTRVITFTNNDLTAAYTAGEATAFLDPETYISTGTANWDSDSWSPDPPGSNIGPPPGSFVIINTGHTITVSTNSKAMATLEIRGRLHLGTTTGHDFGTVTTSGAGARTMQIQSSTFPSGNFSNFTAAGGGTVEYDGVVTLPTQAVYNNLSFTSAGLKTLPNSDLTVNGNFTISGGSVTNAVSNKNITLSSASGNFTNNGTFTTGTGTIIVGGNFTNSGAGVVFNAGTGTGGLRISGNFTNSTNATFNCASDSLGVRGTFTNSATFAGSSGEIHISGAVSNTGGGFTGGSGAITLKASLTNNATFNAGTGAIAVLGSLSNSGAGAVYNANANAISITGSFSNISSGTFNAGSGSVSVNGDWTNSGSFNAATGNVVFNSTSAQTLTGASTFNNLSCVNGGSLTINNDINVGGTLALTSGNIITGSNVVSLTNTTAQPISVYSATGFIDGILSIAFPNTAAASRVYPVGKGTIYRPVTIQQQAASTTPVIRVEMINTTPTGTYPTNIQGMSEVRYFSINLTGGVINDPTVQLSFNTNGTADEAVASPGNVHILRTTTPGGTWTDAGGSGVFSPSAPAGYATSAPTTISGQTYFTIGYEDAALPVTLSRFEGVLKDGVVQLSWTTLTEINNDYFVIERSAGGSVFDSIGFVIGAGTVVLEQNYFYDDEAPLTGRSYYRLKQVDYDGASKYSNIISIQNTNTKAPSLKLYPNPADLSDSINLELENSEDAANAYLTITSLTGVTFFRGFVNLAEETDIMTLNLFRKLDSGIFFITVTAGGFRQTKKATIR